MQNFALPKRMWKAVVSHESRVMEILLRAGQNCQKLPKNIFECPVRYCRRYCLRGHISRHRFRQGHFPDFYHGYENQSVNSFFIAIVGFLFGFSFGFRFGFCLVLAWVFAQYFKAVSFRHSDNREQKKTPSSSAVTEDSGSSFLPIGLPISELFVGIRPYVSMV